MRSLTLAFLLSITLLVGSLAPGSPLSKPTAHVDMSVVRIQVDGGPTICSAFVIDRQRRLLMTADHCMVDGLRGHLTVLGGVLAEVFHVQELDAAVIYVATGDALPPPMIPSAELPEANEEVMAYGYADGELLRPMKLLTIFPQFTVPQAQGAIMALYSPAVIPGMSGGPIVRKGKVIGIISLARNKPPLSLVWPFPPILEATKTYWSEVPKDGP